MDQYEIHTSNKFFYLHVITHKKENESIEIKSINCILSLKFAYYVDCT